jgi:Fic family protein
LKIPVAPPTLEDAVKEWQGEELPKYLSLVIGGAVGPIDEKGRYLHWDKLRHLVPPKGYTPELYWLATRFSRRAITKELPFFKDKKGKAFCFCMPDSVIRDILWISENATGAIQADVRISDPKIKQTYLINSLIEESISSSQLEGASTARRVAKEMIRTGRQPKNLSEKMILNNYQAMSFLRNLKDEQLTPSMVFELHKRLTEDTLAEEDAQKAGVFRDETDDICVFSRDESTVLHIPPKAAELNDRLQAICDFANKTDETDNAYIPPIIRAIIIHFMIGYDHPFVDGNGRTARALFYWMMAKEGFWLMEYISISRAIKKSQSKYMAAYLYSETDSNDLTYFIVHQLEIIRDAIKDLHAYLAQKAEQQRETEYFLKNSALRGALNFRQLELIRNALKSPGAEYSIRSHQTSHGTSYQTARTDLLTLSDEYGLLRKFKAGKTDIFIAPPDLGELVRKYTPKPPRKMPPWIIPE